jgi:DNA-binding GntR family transcriptional regulator
MSDLRVASRNGASLPIRQVLSWSTYEVVKEQIMDLSIAPGSRINMDQLARELQVSNTPLREALSRLEVEGLVTRRGLQGYRASPLLDDRQLSELFTLRLLLEPTAAASAAKQKTTADLVAQLQATIDSMHELAHQPRLDATYHQYRAFVEADAAFHHAIAAASGNQLLCSTLRGLNAHVHNYRLCFRAGMAPETTREHLAVLKAIETGNPRRASTDMRSHLRTALARLLPAAHPDAAG